MARVLVVSHEIDADGALSGALLSAGHDVSVVPDLDQPIELAHPLTFDVVVTGVRGPGIDGTGVVHAVEVVDPGARLVIVASEIDRPLAIEAVRCGAFDDLSMPVQENRLLNTVANAAAIKLATDEARRFESEKRYLGYLENVPAAVVVTDREGRFVEVYGATERMTGFSRDELQRMDVLKLALPIDHERLLEDHKTLVLTGRVESEFSCLTRDGTVQRWLVHAVRISSDRFLGFATDVTQQKVTEEGLVRSRQRLRTIMDAVPSLIFVKDAEGRFLAANQAVADSLGLDVKKVVGRLLSEVGADPDEVHEMLAQDRRVLEEGRPLDIPVERMRDRSGEVHWLRTIKLPYTELDFGEPAVLGVSMDITDRVRAETELEQNLEAQGLLKSLLEESLEEWPLAEAVERLLGRLLSATFIRLAPMGGVFLMESGVLRLKVHQELPPLILSECDGLSLGNCFCGLAASTREIQYTGHEGARRGIPCAAAWEHGHYSVPIVGRDVVLGVILLFVEEGHFQSQREIEFLHAVARIFAGLIIRKRAEELQEGQRKILELISSGEKVLPDVLAAITRVAEESAPGSRCTILLLEGQTVRHGAAPSMPDEYNALLDGLTIGPAAGSCGTAMYRGERVIVEDVKTDPLWADYRALGDAYGFRACWSEPILGSDEAVLGTFALYRSDPACPTDDELSLVESMAHLAGLAIERTQREMKLKKLGRALEQSPVSIVITDAAGDIEYVNPGFCSITGYSFDEVIGKNPRFLQSGRTPASTYEELWSTVLAGGEWRGEWENRNKNGDLCWMRASLSAVRSETGEITNLLGVSEDITDRKSLELEKAALEGQLLQSQKMETIGTLAGGIAHDFNNVLTPILGYSQLAQEHLESSDPLHDDLEDIESAARRAKELVEQILLFSRPTRRDQKLVKIQDVVEEALRLLRATIPSTISIRVVTEPVCDRVLADASQIHQVVLNLCTNAFQAMEETGGSLVIELEQVVVSPEVVRSHPSLSDVEHVRLTVRDSGPGMDEAMRERIFEPFFTTRPVGKGTGLGLSVVHGIVRSHGGEIVVESTPGEGSAFAVYLPVSTEPDSVEEEGPPQVRGGSESLLVVDDDPAVAGVVSRMLEQLGYEVTTFTESPAALESVREDPDRFQMVVSDLTMPDLTGLDLVTRIQEASPDMATLIMTGYGDEVKRLAEEGEEVPEVISKPIEAVDLAIAVRRALDE
jgi:PAS domain S-box-containing protein